MTDEAMSPLRRRMIEDMTIRKFAPKTQLDYVQRVKNFAAFLERSPDTASFEDVRRCCRTRRRHRRSAVDLPRAEDRRRLQFNGRLQADRPAPRSGDNRTIGNLSISLQP